LPTDPPFHTSILAALLLLVRELVPQWPNWPLTEEILALTGASRSQAYAMAARLRELLFTLMGKPGRPSSAPPAHSSQLAVSRAINIYLLDKPGAAYSSQVRTHYLDSFRCFILGLMDPGQPGEGLSVAELAEASTIPLGTLKGWFQNPPEPEIEPQDEHTLRQEHQHQILTLFQSWKGTFVEFCRTVREQHRLNYGTTFIGNLLQRAGLRGRKPQKDRQAVWSAETFRKLFPGAQWLGDGSTLKIHDISVQWGEETFAFNLEAILDVASNALVGMAISDFEDEAVLLSAYQDAIAATGEAPLAMSLDNRASNHTSVVAETMDETKTTLLPTTLGRGQSKAPLEGAFGLLQQEMPELVVKGDTSREKARSCLELALVSWFRGRNGRPCKNLANQSPAEYYRNSCPTDREVEEARRWIQELRERQDRMRRTRAERADQIKLEFLKEMLAELEIDDPDHRLAVDLAYYCRDAIIDGVGIYQAKKQMNTLPANAIPGRYLGGIIRNIHDQLELTLAAEFHLKNRERLKDLSLQRLVDQAQQLTTSTPSTEHLLYQFVTRALAAPCVIDYHFWSLRCVETVERVESGDRPRICKQATRKITATYRAPRDRKHSLLARLARACSET